MHTPSGSMDNKRRWTYSYGTKPFRSLPTNAQPAMTKCGCAVNALTPIASWRSAFGTYSRVTSYRTVQRTGDRTRTGDVQLWNEAKRPPFRAGRAQ
jgi:hypothetical protein